MKYSSQVKPISYLKSQAAEIVKNVSESGEPMLITQNGEAKLVVMDVESYERQEETLALLKLLALGKREIKQGRFDVLGAGTPGVELNKIFAPAGRAAARQPSDSAPRKQHRSFSRVIADSGGNTCEGED